MENGNPEQRRIEMNCSMACVYSVLLKRTDAVSSCFKRGIIISLCIASK